MSEEKEIVTGDFIDKKTGIRFLEDTRGNWHCCYMQLDMSMPQVNIPPAEITVNVPEQVPPNVIVNIPQSPTPQITVSVESPEINIDFCEEKDKKIKRLEDILERMRSENLHLWEIIETAIQMRKKNKNGDKLAMDYIEKAIQNLGDKEND